MGGDFRLKVYRGYPAGWNDPGVTNWLAAASADLLGSEAVKETPMGMGAEDFAYLCQEAPGAMMMIGAAIPDNISRPHHTNIFDLDERVLPLGAAVLAETARRFLTGELALPQKPLFAQLETSAQE